MQTPHSTNYRQRFEFLAEALNGSGGFAPCVQTYSVDNRPQTAQRSYLVPYPRETADKYAARAAVAVYENHLRAACERFAGYITKRKPLRDGLNNPLINTMAQDCDWANNHIDVFWQTFMVEAKARGSMLLLVELPAEQGYNQQDMVDRRLVPYLTAIEPERVTDFALDERKRFAWIKIASTETINGNTTHVDRYWDASGWRVMMGERVLAQGTHPFGECPVLAFTEGGCFPHIGNFAQIADLSRRIYNATSERDEILRSQTFSTLVYQIPPDQAHLFQQDTLQATLGTSNMVFYNGEAPRFIAPPDGPAATYAQALEEMRESIRRIGYATDQPKGTDAESGVALTIRFQQLNAALSSFAQRMQDLEARMWQLVARWGGLRDAPTTQWATDYSMADMERELSTLTAMQATGFPQIALTQQRKRIAGVLFDSMDDDNIAQVLDAIEEGAQEVASAMPQDTNAPAPNDPAAAAPAADDTAPPPPEPAAAPVDLSPVLAQIGALSAKVDAIPVLLAPEPPEPKEPDLSAITAQIAQLQAQIAAIPTEAPEMPALPEMPPPPDLAPLMERLATLAAQVADLQASKPEAVTAQTIAEALRPVQDQITALTMAQQHKPQPVVMLDPTGNVTRQIQINRDADGNITGASVAPQQ